MEHFRKRTSMNSSASESHSEMRKKNMVHHDDDFDPYQMTVHGYDLTMGLNHVDVALDDCNWVDRESLRLSYLPDDLELASGRTLSSNTEPVDRTVLRAQDLSVRTFNQKYERSSVEIAPQISSWSVGDLIQKNGAIVEDMSLFLHEQSIEEFVGEMCNEYEASEQVVFSSSQHLLRTYSALRYITQKSPEASSSLGQPQTIHRDSFLTVSQMPSRSEAALLKEQMCAQTERILEQLLFSF